MHINKIDNSPNFMALKISKKALPKLKELPIESYERILEFGDRIKDIKLYNVHLNETLQYSIRSINPEDTMDYLTSLRNTERLLGTHYTRISYDAGGETEVGGWYPDEPRSFTRKYGKNAPEEYKKFKKLDSYGQMEQYSRMLEEFELERIAKEDAEKTKKEAEENAQKIAQERKDAALNSLMEKFGYDEPTPVVTPEHTKEQKPNKNFLKRLFHIG